MQCGLTVLRLQFDNNSAAQGSTFIVGVTTVPKGQRAVVTTGIYYKLCKYFDSVPALMVFSYAVTFSSATK
jgi:hypothetical protein